MLGLAFHVAAQPEGSPPLAFSQNASFASIIYKPACDPVLAPDQDPNDCYFTSRPTPRIHSIEASTTISAESLRQYLQSKDSPLDVQAEQLAASPYWSTIIGICTIEELNCTINPYGTNNFWGLMASGHLESFPTIEAGIQAINDFLARADANGRSTIESFRGWYCQSECSNWQPVVISTKLKLESLAP